eukprot:5340951-Pyramimonas_sp.AAC.1
MQDATRNCVTFSSPCRSNEETDIHMQLFSLLTGPASARRPRGTMRMRSSTPFPCRHGRALAHARDSGRLRNSLPNKRVFSSVAPNRRPKSRRWRQWSARNH